MYINNRPDSINIVSVHSLRDSDSLAVAISVLIHSMYTQYDIVPGIHPNDFDVRITINHSVTSIVNNTSSDYRVKLRYIRLNDDV